MRIPPPTARAPPCIGSLTAQFTPPACSGIEGPIVKARFRTLHERLPIIMTYLARPDRHESGHHGRAMMGGVLAVASIELRAAGHLA
jgi:hypothetical protein